MSENSTTYNRILSKGIEGELPVTIGVNKLRFTTDTGRLYLDNEGTNRIEITDFVKGLTKDQILGTLAPLPKIYLSSDTHELFIYNSASHQWDSIQSSNAVNASTAQYAVSAASATNASTADYSINASTAEYAENASTSDYAYESLYSTHAEDAQNASSADYAQNATSANYAENAYYAENAGTAEYVSYVENAGTADYASSANYAENATSADYASSANYAETADRANADEYGNYFTVDYAMLNSPMFTGTPTVPDVTAGDESEKIANTNFVSAAISNAIAGITEFDTLVVQTLPETGTKGVIYFVPNGTATGENVYDEYIWITSSSKFEKIGTAEVNLTDYVNTVQVTGTGNAVTGYSKNGSTLTLDKGASFLTAHPAVTHGSSTATATPAAGSTIDVITNITTDNFAHATSFVKTTVTLPNSVATATNASTADYAKNAASVAWNGVSDKPSTFAPVIGNAATQAAAGNHTHTTNISTSAGVNQLTLAANTKYSINTGGTSFVFTMPADNNTTYDLSPYQKKAEKINNAATADYATTAGTANAVAWGNVSGKPDTYPPSSHTHDTNISNYSGATGIDLEHNAKYKLSTGGTSFTFSMPSKPTYDTNISTYSGGVGISLELNAKYKLSTGDTSFTFSMPSKPTYDTNISTYSGGVAINLENGKSYSLSTGGTSFKFKMPENPTSVSTATNASTADYAKAAPWSGITGTPSTYPPSAHSHDVFSTSANGFVPKPASTETGKFLKGDGTWANPSDADHQYFAGTGLNAASTSGNNTTFALATAGTAGTYGPSANVTGNNGTTIKVPQITTDAYGRVTAVTERTYTSVDTDTKVTAVGNHYTPATDNASSLSVNAASGTASWNTDVVKGVTIKRDAKGHVTGLEVSSVKIPGNPNTDHLYYAGTGLNAASTSGNNTTFALSTSGVTSGSYGMANATTGTNNTNINIPYITVDSYGRVTSISNKTYTSVDHTYTLAGLGGIPTTQKGAANGVAELGSDGKVPSSQLPSYVDDVIEGYYYNSKFWKESTHTTEITAESGKIYVDLTSGNNKTYRWSGSAYVIIASDLALGETSSTAYRGDRGKIAYDHSQAAHAPSNAQPNQNAFSNVTVGSTTIAADTTTDTLTLAAGSNVTITPDATNDKITIASTNTTYTFANGTNGFTVTPSDGSAQTVTVTPSITNNVTGSGTSGYIAKWNGTNTVTNGPAFGSATTTYLRNDGSWATPTDHQYFAGTGLNAASTSGNNTTFALSTSGVTSGTYGPTTDVTGNNGATIAIPKITTDAYGRITGASTYKFTAVDHTYTIPVMYNTTLAYNSAVKFATLGSTTYTMTLPNVSSAALPDSGATAGSYGMANATTGAEGTNINIPYITVDAKGRVTSISNKTYTSKNTTYSGTSGRITLSGTAFDLATTGTAGTYGPTANVTGNNGTTIKVPQITTDAYGRVTAVTERTYTSVNTDNDTKNTAGSTDTSSKIFLIGATSQAANPQTYSDNEVYATSGVLTAKSMQVGGGAATIQYNSNTQSIDFVFAS